jgi:hypothetical protein
MAPVERPDISDAMIFPSKTIMKAIHRRFFISASLLTICGHYF